MADLNAHHISFDNFSNADGRILFNRWLNDGFLIRLGPDRGTFRAHNGNITKPDIILTNRHNYHNYVIETMTQNISDHAPMCLILSHKPIKIPTPEREILKKANWPLYTNIIKSKITPINLNNKSSQLIDFSLDTIANIVKNAQTRAIPKCKFKFSHKASNTPKFLRLQKILTQIYNLIDLNANNPVYLRNLNRNKARTIELIKLEAISVHRANWKSMLSELSSERKLNPKYYWSKLKSILGKNSISSMAVTDNGNRTGSILTKACDIEVKFREECIRKFAPPPDDKIDPISLQETNQFHRDNSDIATPLPLIDITRLQPGDPLLKPFHPPDIISVFKSFKNKAPGPDNIKKIHIEHFPKLLYVILTKLFNYCLSTGYYPTYFKKGLMIFIPKAGKDISSPANYRPITLLNLIGKAFGKLVNARLVEHLESNGLSNPLQYGFRKGRGTTSSLALLYERVARKKGNSPIDNNQVSIISRDISGAFDRVWHEKLIVLLHRLNLPPLFIKVMSSFLTEREICIKIYDYIGPAFSPTAGVPQGAPDSPDLFNISTLPFDDLVPPPHTYAPWYCDDLHQLVATTAPVRQRRQAYHKMQLMRAIRNQNDFERNRGILTCVAKSVITPVAQRKNGNLEFNYNGERLKYPYLPSKNSTKILGLNISGNSFTTRHVKEIAANATRMVSSFFCLREIDTQDKLLLIKTLVIPSLTYPDTVLASCSRRSFLKLQRVLNYALKFAYNIRYPSVPTAKSLHIRSKIKPINEIIYNRAKSMWLKIESGNAADPVSLQEILNMPMNNPHTYFPSCYNRVQADVPPPIYTANDINTKAVRRYYD